MERHVKERLIGAAVLVAAAVILIPEMLSGSDPQRADEPVPANGEAPLKTYTIDLSKSPATQVAAIDDRAPPAEIPATADAALAPQAGPESDNAAVAVEPSQSSAVASTALQSAAPTPTQSSNSSPRAAEPAPAPAKPSNPPPRVAESAAATASQAKPAAAPAALAGGHWAVQMGSFSSRATAEKMVKELHAAGHDAFVMPVKSGATTLYRVRVGPMQDRQSAQQALAKLQAKAPGAAIVPHP